MNLIGKSLTAMAAASYLFFAGPGESEAQEAQAKKQEKRHDFPYASMHTNLESSVMICLPLYIESLKYGCLGIGADGERKERKRFDEISQENRESILNKSVTPVMIFYGRGINIGKRFEINFHLGASLMLMKDDFKEYTVTEDRVLKLPLECQQFGKQIKESLEEQGINPEDVGYIVDDNYKERCKESIKISGAPAAIMNLRYKLPMAEGIGVDLGIFYLHPFSDSYKSLSGLELLFGISADAETLFDNFTM